MTNRKRFFGCVAFFKHKRDPYRRYRFKQSHLRLLATLADVREQPGWILPTAAKILVNVTQTEELDTWSGQVEGSQECGMFLCASFSVRCSLTLPEFYSASTVEPV